ncbi:MAG: hypothetical protein P0111_04660 [Nitrospira sp.]|nr:hypothetical protein [Nitrospira sp.]
MSLRFLAAARGCVFPAGEPADVRTDDVTLATKAYKERDNKFTGKIHSVTIELKEPTAAGSATEQAVHEASTRKLMAD